MNSRTTKRFRKSFEQLPEEVQRQARKTFEQWRKNPNHPSLRFKQIHASDPVYSVRIGQGWRALGVREGDSILWFWIGTHADYDELISSL